jgi:hypothetical protein
MVGWRRERTASMIIASESGGSFDRSGGVTSALPAQLVELMGEDAR